MISDKKASELITRRLGDGTVQVITRAELENIHLERPSIRRRAVVTVAEAERRIAEGWRLDHVRGWQTPLKVQAELEKAERLADLAEEAKWLAQFPDD